MKKLRVLFADNSHVDISSFETWEMSNNGEFHLPATLDVKTSDDIVRHCFLLEHVRGVMEVEE